MRQFPRAFWAVVILLCLGVWACSSSDSTPTAPLADGDAEKEDTPVCSGTCLDIQPATCQSSKLCTCVEGLWTLRDCTLDCLLNGGTTPGCGPNDAGEDVCSCLGVDGDTESETEAEPQIELPALPSAQLLGRRQARGHRGHPEGFRITTSSWPTTPKTSLTPTCALPSCPGNGIPLATDMPIGESESSMYDCKFCLQFKKKCSRNEDTGAVDCEKLLMPYGRGSYRIDAMGDEAGQKLTISFKDLYLREVTLDGLGPRQASG